MADDIVTVVHLIGCECDLCKANAEIERLRVELDAERSLADDLYAVLRRLQPLSDGAWAQHRYIEARR